MKMFVLIAALTIAAPLAAQPAAISASDRATGADAHPKLLAEYGGAQTGPQADYVRRVGQRIAVQSGLSNARSDFTVTLLNSSVNNAFAIPGGYVYVTRQLLALMNDEAELASVMGHEVGHVAARHAQARSQTTSIAGVLAGIVGAVAGNSGIGSLVGRGAGTVAQLVTLKFSRGQEYEADDLGVRYLAGGGYDPLASSTMLASLAAQETLDAQIGARGATGPTWASTHPNPASRVARAAATARATGVTGGERNRDAFLNAIDGMRYGDDPAQGVVEGQVFRHPGLKLRFAAPTGYTIVNGSDAVTIAGRGGQAQFMCGAAGSSVDADVRATFAAAGASNVTDVRRGMANGLVTASATVRANTQNGPVDATVISYAMDARPCHFLSVTAAGSGTDPFAPLFDSVARLSPREAAAVTGYRLRVVMVRAGDTMASLSARMAYPTLQLERFRILNAIPEGLAPRPGQRVKIVVRD